MLLGEHRRQRPGEVLDAVGPEEPSATLHHLVGHRCREHERARVHVELRPEGEQRPQEFVGGHLPRRAGERPAAHRVLLRSDERTGRGIRPDCRTGSRRAWRRCSSAKRASAFVHQRIVVGQHHDQRAPGLRSGRTPSSRRSRREWGCAHTAPAGPRNRSIDLLACRPASSCPTRRPRNRRRSGRAPSGPLPGPARCGCRWE